MSDISTSRIIGGNSAYGRNVSDFYPTPPDVTYALLDFLLLSPDTVIWEPACGKMDMVKAIKDRGYQVYATDICDDAHTDYLDAKMPQGTTFIMTNPPFSQAKQFIEKSIDHKVPFAMLLKAHFWNAKSRYELFNKKRPKWILPLTWRPDFMAGTRGKGSPLLDMMWCVWSAENEDVSNYIPLIRPNKDGGRHK